jgi:inner membrane protein YidH
MPASTNLGVQRTFLAQERTLMAWIRTSTSLISFGFAIYKFFEYLREADQLRLRKSLLGPREFALSMIAIGLIVLVIAAIQNKRAIRFLEGQYGETYRSLAGALAILISLIGFSALMIVWLRE